MTRTRTNQARAHDAGLAIVGYLHRTRHGDIDRQALSILDGSAVGPYGQDVGLEVLTDLLCDLRHWAIRNGIVFEGANDLGAKHFLAERIDEMGPRATVRSAG